MERRPRSQGLYLRFKRTFDILASTGGLLAAAPLMLAIAAVIRLTMGKPVLFRQRRPGLDERPITCLKFRTMSDNRDASGQLLPDDQRCTRIGKFLRRSSLDELPQLWNVVIGDLSVVGPRPLLESYLPYYTEWERRRHLVRPGLTGWAQIHGRNKLPFDERLRLDVWYVDHVSWRLDADILLRTVWIVLTHRGYAPDVTSLDELRAPEVTRRDGNA